MGKSLVSFLTHGVDIKRIAYNYVTAILQRCKRGQKCVLLRHTLFPRDFSGSIADTDIINTQTELLRPADVPFGGLQTETKDLGGIFFATKSISGCSHTYNRPTTTGVHGRAFQFAQKSLDSIRQSDKFAACTLIFK